MGGCRWFVHRFSRIFLLIVNIVVALIGAAAIGVGIWGLTLDRDYTDIVDGSDTNFDAYPIVLLIAGIFILALGVMGLIGALCGDKMLGRVLLFLYGIVLGVIVILAIAGAIAGYIRRDDIREDFRTNALRTLNLTLNRTNYLNDWNDVQKDFECCGATDSSDWLNTLWYRNKTTQLPEPDVYPGSCCSSGDGCDKRDFIPEEDVLNGTFTVWPENCVDAISDRISDQIGVIAGVSIAFAVVLLLAVVMAFFVACVKHEASSYEVV